jgi:hypothetical protein
MTDGTKRGSNGGNARKEKLSPERRSEIAKEASKKRWDAVRQNKAQQEDTAAVPLEPPVELPASESEPLPHEKHCPACLAGQSLEEGEGTHILDTVEHPVVLPAAFQDADASVIVATPLVAPQKPSKRPKKPMAKQFRDASSYAQKRLPEAIKEKADLLVEVARREAEIQELTRVIQALGGQAPVGIPANGSYPNPAYQPQPIAPQMPPPYPEYTQPQPQMPVVTPPQPMRMGGAGALDFGFLANE